MKSPILVHYEALKHTFSKGATKPTEWRVNQLNALSRMLSERSADFEQALFDDLGKPPIESQIAEIGFLQGEIADTLKNLEGWIKPTRVPVPAVVLPASAWVRPEPLGTVLIIAPWNYPLMLALSPLIGALAAGNAAIVKPSELAPATSKAIAMYLTEYLDMRAVRVIEGGVDETTELLKLRFDHIFYTGSGRVGRIVARAAAEHLTPITLELGGKSPLYIDETVHLAAAAKRIVWSKFMNAGQTCVAPDYVLATASTIKALEPHLKNAVHELYGSAAKLNSDFGRIVNQDQFDRLVSYLGDGRVITGAEHDRGELFIAPTILADVSRDSSVMQSEIFGPILPLVEVADYADAIEYIGANDKPLGAYVFSEDEHVRRKFELETSSGALTFGAPVIHLTVPHLPFGGVGESGMGSYHGKRSFDTFSHQKAVLSKPLSPDTLGPTIMPPFTRLKDGLVRNLLSKLR